MTRRNMPFRVGTMNSRSSHFSRISFRLLTSKHIFSTLFISKRINSWLGLRCNPLVLPWLTKWMFLLNSIFLRGASSSCPLAVLKTTAGDIKIKRLMSQISKIWLAGYQSLRGSLIKTWWIKYIDISLSKARIR
jgi:hypothetical protein